MSDVKRCDRCAAIYNPYTPHPARRVAIIPVPSRFPLRVKDLCHPCDIELAAWMKRTTPA